MADECVAKVLQAAQAEAEAVRLDRAGDVGGAVARYQISEQAFAEATALANGSHPEDAAALAQHRRELQDRLSYLRGLASGAAPEVPVEQHVKQVQLQMRAPPTAAAAGPTPASGAGDAPLKALGATAAVGAVGGAITLGGLVGLPLTGAVAGAAGLSYAATRPDGLGDAARGVGQAAVATADRVQQADARLGISSAAAAGARQASATVQATGAAVGEVTGRGRESRGGSASDTYKFGDFTRGLVTEGKEARGAGASDGYRFGDFSRGLVSKLSGRQPQSQAGHAGSVAAAATP